MTPHTKLIPYIAVPAFTETSSTELNDLLTKVRSTIFLPTHVSKGQQDLIYKPKYARSLETEPVTARIGGEDFVLKHIDVTTDVPGKRESLQQALNLMQEKRDWDNLPNLLQGLSQARYRPGMAMNLKILRKTGGAGRQDVILECLRRVKDTGMKLTNPTFTIQVLWWFQHKAVVSDWDNEETQKALAWAETAMVMLEDRNHWGKKTLSVEEDPREWPQIHGILLQLAAVRASKHKNGKDEDGKVAQYAKKLSSLQMPYKGPDLKAFGQPNEWLSTHIPTLQGMKLAENILDPSSEVAIDLKVKAADLERLVLEAKEALEQQVSTSERKDGKPLTAFWLYNKLLGSEAL